MVCSKVVPKDGMPDTRETVTWNYPEGQVVPACMGGWHQWGHMP